MAGETSMQLQICLTTEPITGFCYPFCRALVDKLISLEKANGIFRNGIENARLLEKRSCAANTTQIAEIVIGHLCDQLHTSEINDYLHVLPQAVANLIALAKEFLGIFEKP